MLGRPHYDKDDGSAGRVPLYRKACKRCCTGCTLHNVEIEFPVSLGLLVISVNSEVHFIVDRYRKRKIVFGWLHAIFRSKLAGSPGGGVTSFPLDVEGLTLALLNTPEELFLILHFTFLCL
uniref:Uncharacterized protein n=1 Tax=Cucumis melo TaxID=3656 RepID=A0A9I9ELC1_CUCME